MSNVALARAELICPSYGDKELWMVDGIKMPDGTEVRGPSISWMYDTINIPLEWPEPMIGRLAAFYTGISIDRSIEPWNCHMFGAFVTGNADTLRLDDDLNVTNAIKGDRVAHHELENGGLYGFFDETDKIVHTMVGTQVPGACIQVMGHHDPISWSTVDYAQAYGGQLHQYALAA